MEKSNLVSVVHNAEVVVENMVLVPAALLKWSWRHDLRVQGSSDLT
jgi:hypothetical protein